MRRRIREVLSDERMSRRFYSDLFLFDLADEGRIVAERCPKIRSRVGGHLAELAEGETLSLIGDYLREYRSDPLIVGLEDGVGIVLPYGAPSASLGILLIPTLPRRALLRALRRERERHFVWQDALLAESDGYRSADTAEIRAATDSLLWEIEICSRIGDEGGDISSRIHSFSCLAGCPISAPLMDFEESEEIDRGLFHVILLVSLLLCRRISASRMATILLDEGRTERRIGIKIPDPVRAEGRDAWELIFLRTLSDRKRIPFDYVASDLFLTLSFCPARMEWSYLGIKQPEKAPKEEK